MKPYKILFAMIAGLMLVSTQAVMAAGNEAAGKEKAMICQSCHGEGGAASITPDIPVLAGQHQDYLVHALKSYRSGDRKQAIMSTFAQQLSDQDIADLARYFSRQEGSLRDLSVK